MKNIPIALWLKRLKDETEYTAAVLTHELTQKWQVSRKIQKTGLAAEGSW